LGAALSEVDRASQRFSPKNAEWDWRFRVLKAQILISQSDPRSALALLHGELPPSLSAKDVAVRKSLFEGIALRYTQEFEQAEKKLKEAEFLAASSQPQLTGQVLNAQGALEVDEHKFASAEATLRRALIFARQQKNRQQEASALGNLARTAFFEGHFGEGVDESQAALLLSRSLGLQSTEATLLGNLGWCYFQLGDFENALAFFKQAADASQRTGLTGYAFYWQGTLAQAYQELNDNDSAQALLKMTVDNASKLGNKQTMTENLNYLVRLSLKTNHLDDAEKYNRQARQIEEAGLDHFGVLESQLLAGRIATLRKEFAQSESHFRTVIRDPAADTFLKWEAQAGLAETYEGKLLPARAEQEYLKSIDTFESDRAAIDRDELRLSFLARGIASYDAYIGFLIRRGRPLGALRVAEQSRARTLEEGLASSAQAAPVSSSILHPQEIAQKLKASLFFYWIGQKNSYLWVITPAKTTYFKLPKASDIEPLVKTYREALPNVDDAQDPAASDGKKLYAMLVDPAKKLIPAGSRVILLPAESLYGLNFETLIVPDPKPHFWIEDVTLTTANSLTLLDASIQRPAITGKNLLLVGNAVPTPGYPALPQAPVEIQKVGHYFSDQNRKVLEAKQATATAYLSSNPGQYAYLHFVTHGTASITRPLESAVILSPEGDAYKLYARDIVTHHLNAQLVTISACNGSGTRAYSGEGLVGLSWAFLRAGAHNVIGALWEVSDASTPQLMDAFYRELFQGKDTATALRDAKLSLLHTADPDSVFKRPNYWAPFQLYAGS
jgi:CHAT domain-containing protein